MLPNASSLEGLSAPVLRHLKLTWAKRYLPDFAVLTQGLALMCPALEDLVCLCAWPALPATSADLVALLPSLRRVTTTGSCTVVREALEAAGRLALAPLQLQPLQRLADMSGRAQPWQSLSAVSIGIAAAADAVLLVSLADLPALRSVALELKCTDAASLRQVASAVHACPQSLQQVSISYPCMAVSPSRGSDTWLAALAPHARTLTDLALQCPLALPGPARLAPVPLAAVRRAVLSVDLSDPMTLAAACSLLPSVTSVQLIAVGMGRDGRKVAELLTALPAGSWSRLECVGLRSGECTVDEFDAVLAQFPLLHTIGLKLVLHWDKKVAAEEFARFLRLHGSRLFQVRITNAARDFGMSKSLAPWARVVWSS
jgi:hypothetical protein